MTGGDALLPLLLRAPASRPARVVGQGPGVLRAVRHLRDAGWPVTVHDPQGAPTLSFLPGVHTSTSPPGAQLIRQASLVLLGAQAPEAWRGDVLRDIRDTGVPFWDEADGVNSTLGFPSWLPGRHLSVALWSNGPSAPWEAMVAEDFLRGMDGLYILFFTLMEELRSMVFDGMPDAEFRERVISQVTRPEILAMLLRGERDVAKTTVLRIVGSTTRTLE